MLCRSGCDSHYVPCLDTEGCAWDAAYSLCDSSDGVQKSSVNEEHGRLSENEIAPTTAAPSTAAPKGTP